MLIFAGRGVEYNTVTVCTPWATKSCHFYFYDNFGKCGPISIILSLLDS